jgi:hypothetical protein
MFKQVKLSLAGRQLMASPTALSLALIAEMEMTPPQVPV